MLSTLPNHLPSLATMTMRLKTTFEMMPITTPSLLHRQKRRTLPFALPLPLPLPLLRPSRTRCMLVTLTPPPIRLHRDVLILTPSQIRPRTRTPMLTSSRTTTHKPISSLHPGPPPPPPPPLSPSTLILARMRKSIPTLVLPPLKIHVLG